MPAVVTQYAALLSIAGVVSGFLLLCVDGPRRKREKLINATLAKLTPEERMIHLRDFRTVQPPHTCIRAAPTAS